METFIFLALGAFVGFSADHLNDQPDNQPKEHSRPVVEVCERALDNHSKHVRKCSLHYTDQALTTKKERVR